MPEPVTRQQAALALRCDERTIRRLIERLELQPLEGSSDQRARGRQTLFYDLEVLRVAKARGFDGHSLLAPDESGFDGHDLMDMSNNVSIKSSETTGTVKPGEKLTRDENVHQIPSSVEMSIKSVNADPDAKNALSIRDPALIPPEELERARLIFEACQKLHRVLMGSRHGERTEMYATAGKPLGLGVMQMRRHYDTWRTTKNTTALARRQRADAGQRRLPQALVDLIETVCITNPQANPRRVYRIIELVKPSALRYLSSSRAREKTTLSLSSITRIREALRSHPVKRFAFGDGKARKEFLRVWAGEVIAGYASELYEADMTRCDCVVYDADTGKMLRLRIHAQIDVFSGAVPGFVFSREENQRQTDRMVLLALMEKPGDWARLWPVWGTPKRMYWDNGKTYASTKSHTMLETLGVEVVHSSPKVSHTRGGIERFFGTFHQTFEKLMPGYAGENATQRDHDTIGKLLHNTERWLAGGAQPEKDPYPERLLLVDEYQRRALGWLVNDYHQTVVDGKTRQEWFTSTVPAGAQVRYEFGDLDLIMSHREERVVTGNGSVRYRGAEWTLTDAALLRYQGQTVVLLVSEMMQDTVIRVAVRVGDRLHILGTLEPMRWAALSPQAREYRRAAKKELGTIRASADEYRATYTDPEFRADAAFLRGLPDAKPTSTEPRALHLTARLETTPTDPAKAEQEAAINALLSEGYVLDEEVDM